MHTSRLPPHPTLFLPLSNKCWSGRVVTLAYYVTSLSLSTIYLLVWVRIVPLPTPTPLHAAAPACDNNESLWQVQTLEHHGIDGVCVTYIVSTIMMQVRNTNGPALAGGSFGDASLCATYMEITPAATAIPS